MSTIVSRRRQFLSATLLGLFLAACGAEKSPESSLSMHRSGRPVFFAIGGNNSCAGTASNPTPGPEGSHIYIALRQTLLRIYDMTHVMPEFFVACHGSGSHALSYLSSWNPVVAYNRTEQEVRQLILGKRSLIGTSSAFLIGHSYGGWLAMSILSHVTEESDFIAIYTIDPISKVACGFTHPFGCQDSPSDISLAERQKIADHSKKWINFYQRRTNWMRSNSIFQATENHRIYSRHLAMDDNREVWDIIYNSSIHLF